MSETNEIEVWLVSLPGTEMYVPYRIVLPTLIGLGYTRWGLHALPLSMPGETIAQRCARDPALAAAINADLTRLQQQADHLVSALAEPIAGLAAALLAERHLDTGRIHAILQPFDVTDPTEPQP